MSQCQLSNAVLSGQNYALQQRIAELEKDNARLTSLVGKMTEDAHWNTVSANKMIAEYAQQANDAAEKIEQLRDALQELQDVASQCDSWESFPSIALEAADKVLEQTK